MEESKGMSPSKISAVGKPVKVLLDTDIGGDIDDAACLAYLLRQPNCELLGITTVCGNPLERAMIADAICQVAGKTIPIYPGLDPKTPNGWYPTPDGQVKLKNWKHRTDFAQDKAVDFLYETICTYPNEVNLIGIGSFSNIAALFAKYPDAPDKLKEIAGMAGVFDEEINASDAMPYCNWNVWADPLAAKTVFSRARHIRVYGLEITRQLTLSREEVKTLFTSDILQAVVDFGEPWLAENTMTFHDPLVATAVFNRNICTYRRGYIEIDTRSANEETLGRTTFIPDAQGNCELATSVNIKGFFASYFEVVNSLR